MCELYIALGIVPYLQDPIGKVLEIEAELEGGGLQLDLVSGISRFIFDKI